MKYKVPIANSAFEHNSGTEGLLNAMVFGGKALGYSQLSITGAVKTFADALAAMPLGSQFALCVLEADAAEADAARVCRFRQDSGVPSAGDGMPVGDNGSFEINGEDNIADFQIVGITPANTHTLHITWFGANP